MGALHISVWRDAADRPDVEALHAEIAQLCDQLGHPVAIVMVVEPGVGLSTATARAAALAMVKELGEHLAAITVVIEGVGFGPAAVRGMFTGIGLVARPGFPWKMFAEADAATAWAVDHVVAAGAPSPPIIAALLSIEKLRHAA